MASSSFRSCFNASSNRWLDRSAGPTVTTGVSPTPSAARGDADPSAWATGKAAEISASWLMLRFRLDQTKLFALGFED
jgi:hypothetical protein